VCDSYFPTKVNPNPDSGDILVYLMLR